jgi:DNA polymerase elongation subunit (family B)
MNPGCLFASPTFAASLRAPTARIDTIKGVIIGLDIETDTTIDGRNPQHSRVVAVALSSSDGAFSVVLDNPDESALLTALVEHISQLSSDDVVVTWNGAGFDLPFLEVRAETLGVDLPWSLWPSKRVPKYEPVGVAGPLRASFGHVGHVDVAYMYKDIAEAAGVQWALKPVSLLCGLEPVQVDRERIHELSPDELSAYVTSDAKCTAYLAFLQEDVLSAHLD